MNLYTLPKYLDLVNLYTIQNQEIRKHKNFEFVLPEYQKIRDNYERICPLLKGKTFKFIDDVPFDSSTFPVVFDSINWIEYFIFWVYFKFIF